MVNLKASSSLPHAVVGGVGDGGVGDGGVGDGGVGDGGVGVGAEEQKSGFGLL